MLKKPAPPPLPWLFVGTIPDPAYPLTLAPCAATGEGLLLGERPPVHCGRGTPAMLVAAVTAYARLVTEDKSSLHALVAGDTGNGAGSREIYVRLLDILPIMKPRGITFHYLLPDVDWHNRILLAIEALQERPLLTADAGYMYAAKMSGYAGQYDLFTPDIGELAFLADEKAPHPFYTRNFLLADETMAPELIQKACEHGNAAKHMLVKGHTDRFVLDGKVLDSVDEPDVPALEPIGGTGDTLTGIASACLAAGMPMRRACLMAMRANRRMGELAAPTPASSIADMLRHLPMAISEIREHETKSPPGADYL